MKILQSKTVLNLILLIVISTFVQSCVAYHTTPTTLNSALNMGAIKIEDQSGATYKYKSIFLKEGVYYGTGGVYANTNYKATPEGVITVLDSANYKAVYVKDKKKSKRQSVWLGIGIAIPVAYLLLGLIVTLAYL